MRLVEMFTDINSAKKEVIRKVSSLTSKLNDKDTQQALAALQKAYNAIENINPDGPYNKLTAYLDNKFNDQNITVNVRRIIMKANGTQSDQAGLANSLAAGEEILNMAVLLAPGSRNLEACFNNGRTFRYSTAYALSVFKELSKVKLVSNKGPCEEAIAYLVPEASLAGKGDVVYKRKLIELKAGAAKGPGEKESTIRIVDDSVLNPKVAYEYLMSVLSQYGDALANSNVKHQTAYSYLTQSGKKDINSDRLKGIMDTLQQVADELKIKNRKTIVRSVLFTFFSKLYNNETELGLAENMVNCYFDNFAGLDDQHVANAFSLYKHKSKFDRMLVIEAHKGKTACLVSPTDVNKYLRHGTVYYCGYGQARNYEPPVVII